MPTPSAPAPLQLDIFSDSRDVMLRNDLRGALERRDAVGVREARERLAAEYPEDDMLPLSDILCTALADGVAIGQGPLRDHAVFSAAARALRDRVLPAAEWALGARGAPGWAAPLWRDLARRGADLDYVKSVAGNEHAAVAWLAAGDWVDAARCVDAIPSWRRIPEPLGWMAEARYRSQGIDATWPLLVELAWLAPARFDSLLRKISDPLLNRLRRRYEDHVGDHGDDCQLRDLVAALSWFPAWVLTETPALSPHLAQAEPGLDTPAERGLRLMVQLLGLERQGRNHEAMDRRRALRDLSPMLSKAFMATRS